MILSKTEKRREALVQVLSEQTMCTMFSTDPVNQVRNLSNLV